MGGGATVQPESGALAVIVLPPKPRPPEPRLRIDRIVTVDADGDVRWWDPDDLKSEHPELFRA